MSDKPKGYLVQWWGDAAYSFFRDKDSAEIRKEYNRAEGISDCTITPLYTRAQSPSDAKLEAIRAALERCNDSRRAVSSRYDFEPTCEHNRDIGMIDAVLRLKIKNILGAE